MIKSTALAVAMFSVTASATPVQDPTHSHDAFSPDHLVTIEVSEMDRPVYIPAHTIRIEAVTSQVARSRQELESRAWLAKRLSGAHEENVSSADCPGLRDAVLDFARLAAVPIVPPTMRVETAPLPIPPTPKDGLDTRVMFRTVTSDGSEATVQLRNGTTYSTWAQRTVERVAGCFGSWPS